MNAKYEKYLQTDTSQKSATSFQTQIRQQCFKALWFKKKSLFKLLSSLAYHSEGQRTKPFCKR